MARKWDVYGMGNALVDVQYQVDPSFLERMQIEKGVMTLIDGARQLELVESLRGTPAERSSGGSAANTMITVANVGGHAYYACRVADDEDGDFYLRDLEAAGVASNPTNRGSGITGNCSVFITPDADRTMNTFLGITSTFGPAQVEADVIPQAHYLYIEGYLLTADTGYEAARQAQAAALGGGTKVALTLSDPSVVSADRARVAELVAGGVDLLFCNDAEARAFTGVAETSGACAALGQMVPQFAVTCGSDGARIGADGEIAHVPGFPVEPVDTNGAGDTFAGAYLYGLTHGLSAAESAKLASFAASRVVAKYGPRLNVSLAGEVSRILAL